MRRASLQRGAPGLDVRREQITAACLAASSKTFPEARRTRKELFKSTGWELGAATHETASLHVAHTHGSRIQSVFHAPPRSSNCVPCPRIPLGSFSFSLSFFFFFSALCNSYISNFENVTGEQLPRSVRGKSGPRGARCTYRELI